MNELLKEDGERETEEGEWMSEDGVSKGEVGRRSEEAFRGDFWYKFSINVL